MTPELWARLNPLFDAAIEMPRAERSAFIAEVCGGDAELRRELVALIDAHEQPDGLSGNIEEHIRTLVDGARREFAPADVVMGRFRIVRKLGRGGMGDVYEAFDLQLSEAIALKAIRPEIVENAGVLARFRKEVQLARRLSGPNVCRIHELFVLGGGADPDGAFLTMELLDGVTLSERIQQSGPIPWREAQELADGICSGVAAIHEAGMIHRDLKSRNIMLVNRAGSTCAVVMDFGLAHEIAPSQPDAPTGLTLPGAVLGTPEYMAPEQFEAKEVTPATDIFSLGVVLYEMLTGKNPFPSSNMLGAAVLRGRQPERASSLQRSVPHRLEHVIAKCLEYDPGRRYQSAGELARALKARYALPAYPAVDRPWILRIAAVVLAAAAVLGAFAWWQSRLYYRPNAEAEYWYGRGLAALREGSSLKATLLLGDALQHDSRFAMAHARLAEAWSNLDFDGAAQREMLIATSLEGRAPALDRLYIDAIRATLIPDFREAVKDYKEILGRLPQADKWAGYLDLGMACERAGDPANAADSFNKALSLNGDNPAPYLQKAILETHQDQDRNAGSDFNRAESLYQAEMNPEGLAELDYERGYLANGQGKWDDANAYLERALSEAQHLPQPSVQLEIRALTQLSSVAYASGGYGKAEGYANNAIQLARDNQLTSWAADGLVRRANAELAQADYDGADRDLKQAMGILSQARQDRVQAMASLTLASLRNQQQRSAEVLAPAQAALAYYKANGYVTEAGQATLLIGRTERRQGNWPQALETAGDLLALAKAANRNILLVQAEELKAGVYLDMEDYPNALEHYRTAFSSAQNKVLRQYEAMDCADVLWRLGRFAEAEKMLESAPPSNTGGGEIEVDSLLAQLQYGAAARRASELIGKSPDMPATRMRDLHLDLAIAEAALGKTQAARTGLGSLLAPGGQPAALNGQPLDAGGLAGFELAAARIDLTLGDAKAAFDQAAKAESYFQSQRLLDSEFRSSLLAALAAQNLRDARNREIFTKKSLDIETQLGNTWSNSDSHSYLSRPDIVAQLRSLHR